MLVTTHTSFLFFWGGAAGFSEARDVAGRHRLLFLIWEGEFGTGPETRGRGPGRVGFNVRKGELAAEGFCRSKVEKAWVKTRSVNLPLRREGVS